MTEPQHTPLPWDMSVDVSNYPAMELMLCERESRGVFLEGGLLTDPSDDVNRANAEFLVRAANSHYELLEALKGVIEIAEIAAGEWEYGTDQYTPIAEAHAAIKNAEASE